MKKKIIIPSIIILLLLGIVLFLVLLPKTYTLKNNKTNKVSLILRKDKEKNIKLKVEEDKKNIVLKNFNNKQNTSYIIYIIKDKNKIINKGLIHNTDNTIIPNISKGEYTLTLIYKGINKFKVDGQIFLEEDNNEYSTLKEGYIIKNKIKEITGMEYKDNTIKNIKIAKKLD